MIIDIILTPTASSLGDRKWFTREFIWLLQKLIYFSYLVVILIPWSRYNNCRSWKKERKIHLFLKGHFHWQRLLPCSLIPVIHSLATPRIEIIHLSPLPFYVSISSCYQEKAKIREYGEHEKLRKLIKALTYLKSTSSLPSAKLLLILFHLDLLLI